MADKERIRPKQTNKPRRKVQGRCLIQERGGNGASEGLDAEIEQRRRKSRKKTQKASWVHIKSRVTTGKVMADKPEHLDWIQGIPQSRKVKPTPSCKLSSDLHRHHGIPTYTCLCTYILNGRLKNTSTGIQLLRWPEKPLLLKESRHKEHSPSWLRVGETLSRACCKTMTLARRSTESRPETTEPHTTHRQCSHAWKSEQQCSKSTRE